MQIPPSDILTTSTMNRVFDNTVATYKFYWLLSPLDIHIVFCAHSINSISREKRLSPKSLEKMKEFRAGNHSIIVVNKEDVISKKDELGFNEFGKWTIDTDLQILLDEDLLICLQNLDTRGVVFEAA